MMKSKLVILLIAVLIPTGIFAQKKQSWHKPLYDTKPFHFGFAFSGGIIDFSVDHKDNFGASLPDGSFIYDSIRSVEGISKPMFGASVVGVLRFNDLFNLRFSPGLSFGQRDLKYIMIPENSTTGEFVTHTMKIESAMIQLPLHFKYRSTRESNYRPYLLAGINYTLDLASNKVIKSEEKPKIRLNTQDVLLDLGFGIDYYLSYFKLSTELRFSYGLTNVVTYDNQQQTAIFNRLGTKMFTFAVFFE